MARGKGRPRVAQTAAPSLVDILNLVRALDLERKGELGRAVVADRLRMLGDLGLIDESELGMATGGRAPRLAARRGRVLVATLDQSALGMGVADLAGNLLTEHHEAFKLTAPPQALAEGLTTLLRWSQERQAASTGLWGISLSVPGAAGDVPTRTPPVLPAREGFLLVEQLTRSFGAPVWMRSSVDTMTMGELHGGAAQGLRSMLFVKVGRRVTEGRLFRGAQGATGLIGALSVHQGDRMGRLDAMAGADMILREGRREGPQPLPLRPPGARRRGHGHRPGPGRADGRRALRRDPHHLGPPDRPGRGHPDQSQNPEVTILSGAIVQTNDIILAAVREAVCGASHPLVTRDLRILRSQKGSSAGLVGAELRFAPGFLKDWVMQGSPLRHPGFLAFREALDTAPPPPPLKGAP